MNAQEVEKAHENIREAVATLVRIATPGALVTDLTVVASIHAANSDGSASDNVLAIPAYGQPIHRTLGLLQAGYIGFYRRIFP